MARKKLPVHGPPAPVAAVVELRRMIDESEDPVEVIDATLRLADWLRSPVPMGGGLTCGDRATEHARNVVAMLRRRGMLA